VAKSWREPIAERTARGAQMQAGSPAATIASVLH
jgi:hypothetical protein